MWSFVELRLDQYTAGVHTGKPKGFCFQYCLTGGRNLITMNAV